MTENPKPATKTCIYCKSEIPADASHCAHCGKDVSVAGALKQLGCTLFLVGAALLLAIYFCSGGLSF